MFSGSAVQVKRRAKGYPSGRDIEPLGWFQSIFRLIQKLLCGQKPSNPQIPHQPGELFHLNWRKQPSKSDS